MSQESLAEQKSKSQELVEGLVKKLTESDLLETQEYSKVIKKILTEVKTRIASIEEIQETLSKRVLDAEQGASLAEPEEGESVVETAYTAQLGELRAEVADIYQQVIDEARNQIELIENMIALRRRTDEKMATLFKQIFSESSNIEDKTKSVAESLQKLAAPNPNDIARRETVLRKLNKIKRDRCVFFGCIDIHPEELFQITGNRSS